MLLLAMSSSGAPPVTPKQIVGFLADFLLKPTPLRMIVRSQPAPPARDWDDRGEVGPAPVLCCCEFAACSFPCWL
jgi:hypothetical protein